MAEIVNLADEFTAPEPASRTSNNGSSVNLLDEFSPAPKQEQHAIINDAAAKIHFWKQADPQERGLLLERWFPEGGEEIKRSFWETQNTPLVRFPQINPEAIPDDIPHSQETKTNYDFPGASPMGSPSLLAGAYNGAAHLASEFTTPLSLETLGTFGALIKLAQGSGMIATSARHALTVLKTYFGVTMAEGAGATAGKLSVDTVAGTAEKTQDVVELLVQGALAAASAGSAISDVGGKKLSPIGESEVPKTETSKEPMVEAGGKPVPSAAPIPLPSDAYVTVVDYGGYKVPTIDVPSKDGRTAFSGSVEEARQAGYDVQLPEDFPEGQHPISELLKPKLDEEFVPPTEIASQPAVVPVEEVPPAVREHVTSIKNAVVDEERASRGLKPAMAGAARIFGKVWDDALHILDEKPTAASDLVTELNDTPRSLTDTEDALLLHRQITLQNVFDKLTTRINEAGEIGNEATLEKDRIDLSKVSDDLLDLYNADRLAGTETGRGLNARKMLANEDYSLAKMVVTKRAVNDGQALTPEQEAEVKGLHEKIAATQKAFDEYRARIEAEKPEREPRRQAAPNAVSKFISMRAEEARIRIKARSGRVRSGIDPIELADHAIVGAEYIARGVTKLADWSVEMVKEFGEAIRPHLQAIFDRSKTEHDSLELTALIEKRKATVENQIKTFQEKIERNDLSAKPTKVGRPSIEEIEKLEQERDQLRDTLTGMREQAAKIKELEEAIAEKKGKIASGELAPEGQKINRPATAEIEKLKLERDKLNTELDEARKQANKPSDEEVVQKKVEALQERISKKKKMLETGDIAPKNKPINRPQVRALEEAKQELDQLNHELDEVRKGPPKTAEQIRLQELDRQIKKVEEQLKSGELFPKGDKIQPTSKEIYERQKRLEDLKQERQLARESIQPRPERPSAEETALKTYKTRTRNRIEELKRRVSEEDFAPKEKAAPVKLDPEGETLAAEVARAKQAYQESLMRDRLSKRTKLEKMKDTFVKWRRGFLLSSPVTLAKLTAAAAQRGIITPIEEGVGAVIGTVLPTVAANAPREGGFSVSAEARAITEAFTTGMKDAADTLKTGHSDLDMLYGKGKDGAIRESDVMPRSIIDFFGSLHGALKAPVKRAEFIRSFNKRIEFAIRKGADVTDPMVQTRIAVEAYKDANRSIFLQDNLVVDAYNAAVKRLLKVDADGKPTVGGVLASGAARVLLPIVRVPTNIVAEIMTNALGLVSAPARLLSAALGEGVRNLSEEQSDLIMRELKKGALGGAMLLLGYLNADKVGGYYQAGQKRDARDVKVGSIRVFGHDVPSYLLHNPLLETLQIGATVRRVAESKIKGEKQGLANGTWTAALGLTEQVPFAREAVEMSKMFNPKERPYAEGELAKSFLVPSVADFTARQLDKKTPFSPLEEPQKRKPASILQHIETGVPILRQVVPAKH